MNSHAPTSERRRITLWGVLILVGIVVVDLLMLTGLVIKAKPENLAFFGAFSLFLALAWWHQHSDSFPGRAAAAALGLMGIALSVAAIVKQGIGMLPVAVGWLVGAVVVFAAVLWLEKRYPQSRTEGDDASQDCG